MLNLNFHLLQEYFVLPSNILDQLGGRLMTFYDLLLSDLRLIMKV